MFGDVDLPTSSVDPIGQLTTDLNQNSTPATTTNVDDYAMITGAPLPSTMVNPPAVDNMSKYLLAAAAIALGYFLLKGEGGKKQNPEEEAAEEDEDEEDDAASGEDEEDDAASGEDEEDELDKLSNLKDDIKKVFKELIKEDAIDDHMFYVDVVYDLCLGKLSREDKAYFKKNEDIKKILARLKSCEEK